MNSNAREPSHVVLNELVRFVVARLDDDYREIKRAARIDGFGSYGEHRARVEHDARREIVGVAQRMAVLRDLPSEVPVRACAVDMVRAMAGVWADHPYYRASWRAEALPPVDEIGRSGVLDPV